MATSIRYPPPESTVLIPHSRVLLSGLKRYKDKAASSTIAVTPWAETEARMMGRLRRLAAPSGCKTVDVVALLVRDDGAIPVHE